jgi:hypothetical protein
VRLKTTGVAVSVAAALALGACGGDDDDGESISKQEFVAQADEICEESDARIEAEGRKVFANRRPSQQEIVTYMEEVVIPEVTQQVDAVDQLPVPEGDEEQIQAVVDSAREGLETAEADPARFAGTEGEDSEDPFDEASRLAGEYGIQECGD